MSSDSNHLKALRETPAPPPEAQTALSAAFEAGAHSVHLGGGVFVYATPEMSDRAMALMRRAEQAESLLISQQAALEHLRQERDRLKAALEEIADRGSRRRHFRTHGVPNRWGCSRVCTGLQAKRNRGA